MTFIIARFENNVAPIEFACTELTRYLKQIDPSVIVECRNYEKYDETVDDVIWLGTCINISQSDDDAISIQIHNAGGIITGSNPRSVLMSAYRFLYELGCRFYRYGEIGADADNEYIPHFNISTQDLNMSVDEKPSYRHRSICIEGAVSYEHVQAIINWLPKVGLNGYYVQFKVPHTFFNAWSEHKNNPLFEHKTLSRDDVTAIYNCLVSEIKKRGLSLHAMGHGWTCEPLGLDGSGWYETDAELPSDKKELLAMVNGSRSYFQNVPLNTNLCYSNPNARNIITSAIVDYCAANPAVDYLHFWLADSKNAQCECENCCKMLPSDYYIMMLNELDEKLTAQNLKTKIVFLIYYDLLWKGNFNSINNPDRFVLMFAPISRTYSQSFTSVSMADVPNPPEFTRNALTLPRTVKENLAFLKAWQQDFTGDSFDFDYHLMWDHVRDMGYYDCARILHTDMCNLHNIGLNGMVSCQVQRAAFPTNLPMYAMARGLWNKQSDFDEIADEYFKAEFGNYSTVVQNYLSQLSKLINLPYLRRESDAVTPQLIDDFKTAIKLTEEFEDLIIQNQLNSMSWQYLTHHAHMVRNIGYALIEKASGNPNVMNRWLEALEEYTRKHEPEIHRVLDVENYLYVLRASLRPGKIGE